MLHREAEAPKSRRPMVPSGLAVLSPTPAMLGSRRLEDRKLFARGRRTDALLLELRKGELGSRR